MLSNTRAFIRFTSCNSNFDWDVRRASMIIVSKPFCSCALWDSPSMRANSIPALKSLMGCGNPFSLFATYVNGRILVRLPVTTLIVLSIAASAKSATVSGTNKITLPRTLRIAVLKFSNIIIVWNARIFPSTVTGATDMISSSNAADSDNSVMSFSFPSSRNRSSRLAFLWTRSMIFLSPPRLLMCFSVASFVSGFALARLMMRAASNDAPSGDKRLTIDSTWMACPCVLAMSATCIAMSIASFSRPAAWNFWNNTIPIAEITASGASASITSRLAASRPISSIRALALASVSLLVIGS